MVSEKRIQEVLAAVPSKAAFLEYLYKQAGIQGIEVSYDDFGGLCYWASAEVLKPYLAEKGIDTIVVCGKYMDSDDHCWLETLDGIVIDPTECQFVEGIDFVYEVPPGRITVYKERPDKYKPGEFDVHQEGEDVTLRRWWFGRRPNVGVRQHRRRR